MHNYSQSICITHTLTLTHENTFHTNNTQYTHTYTHSHTHTLTHTHTHTHTLTPTAGDLRPCGEPAARHCGAAGRGVDPPWRQIGHGVAGEADVRTVLTQALQGQAGPCGPLAARGLLQADPLCR